VGRGLEKTVEREKKSFKIFPGADKMKKEL